MLQNATKKLEEDIQKETKEDGQVPKMTGTEFENRVGKALQEVGIDKDKIYHSPQKFPDFIITDDTGDKIGLEVKKTDSAKWEVIGGSIYESLRNDIEETYVVMGKLGGDKPEVRLRKYAECLADLKVTHSPRFYLDMTLEEGQDYLTTHDSKDLLDLTGDELNRRIRQLLRSNKSTWWSEEETTPFSSLSEEEKGAYLNDGLALFPEIFGGNYENFTPWLIYSCLVWCGNIRDIFSAGGNKELPEKDIFISAVMFRALDNIESIVSRINDMSDEEIKKFWHIENPEECDRIATWRGLARQNLKLSSKVIENNKKRKKYQGWPDEEIIANIIQLFFEAIDEKIG
jgi:hypothetical protein